MRMCKCVNTCFDYPDRKASCSLFLDYWSMKIAAIKCVAFVEDTAHCSATEETDDTDISTYFVFKYTLVLLDPKMAKQRQLDLDTEL